MMVSLPDVLFVGFKPVYVLRLDTSDTMYIFPKVTLAHTNKHGGCSIQMNEWNIYGDRTKFYIYFHNWTTRIGGT